MPTLLSLYGLNEGFGTDWSAIDRLDPEATVAWDRDMPPGAKAERILVAGGKIPWVVTRKYGHMLYLDGRWHPWDVASCKVFLNELLGSRADIWDGGYGHLGVTLDGPDGPVRLLLSRSARQRVAMDRVSGYSDPPGILGEPDGSPEVIDPGQLADLISQYV